MAAASKRQNLGRGLSALFGDTADDYAQLDKVRAAKTVPVEHLHPGRFQPRRVFNAEAISELAESIRQKGVLQPLLVRRDPNNPSEYEIIAGERRWRAAQQAQLHEVPVVIREFDDKDAAEIALVENIQRADLTALEEAEGYRRLIEEFSYTQEDLAKAVGKSRSHVANTMRLLVLPAGVRVLVDDGKLTAGHARTLINHPDAEHLARRMVDEGLTVRQAEKLVQMPPEAPAPGKAALSPSAPSGARARPRGRGAPVSGTLKDPNIVELEQKLTARLGLTVQIDGEGEVGSVSIHYASLEQLEEVVRRLTLELERPRDLD
jgi:ParB family transcriptional regulator, chromosome partitioning protein